MNLRTTQATTPWLVTLALCGAMPASASARVSPEATAPAETPAQKQARELRAKAEQAFFDGDYATAITTFERAFELSPHSTDLFNLGRIHEEQGDLPAALEYYERFAEQPRLSLDQRRTAAERIEVLRKIVETPGSNAPPPAGPPLQPAMGNDGSDEFEPEPGRAIIITGATLTGIGAALAISGGVGFGLVAQRNAERVNVLADGENPGRLTLSETEDLHTQGRNAEALQITFIATGGTLALVGGALLVTGLVQKNKSEQRLSAVGPTIGPNTLGAVARFRF